MSASLCLTLSAVLWAQDPAKSAPFAAVAKDLVAAVDSKRIEGTVRRLAEFGTRHVLSRTDSPTEGTGAARAWLKAQFDSIAAASGGRLTVALQEAKVACVRPGLPKEIQVVNVLATLRGTTDPDRVYVIGGHYDSRNGKPEDGKAASPGANDDASGTAVALEVCRVLAQRQFPATILFAAFDGEEQGLLGSEAHAKSLAASGVQVDGMIGCDIVGNTLGVDGKRYDGYVRCFSYAPSGNDSAGRSLARAVAEAARSHVPGFAVKLVFRGDRYGRGGDHRSFFDAGYPAVRMSEPREDLSRQHADLVERDGKPYGDLPEFCDFAYTAKVARTVAATMAELASAPPPPVALKAEGMRDRYDTQITFTLPAGAAGCEFVWRDTTAADWEGVIAMRDAAVTAVDGGKRTATLRGVCLDDVVVGVRSVATNGARSRVATPPEPDRILQRPKSQESSK